jgi:hypothetical protein
MHATRQLRDPEHSGCVGVLHNRISDCALQYRFKLLEYNGLKGLIGEQLARSFFRSHLAPRLRDEEGWDHVVLSKNDYRYHKWTWNTKIFKHDHLREDFIVHGFYADRKLISKYAIAVGILEQNHCIPDGLLFKLRETGRKMKFRKDSLLSISRSRIDALKQGNVFIFPIVSGDLEIIEIKCGRKAKLADKQKKTYNDLIVKGVPLRLIKVRTVSFDLNRFLVEERKYENLL